MHFFFFYYNYFQKASCLHDPIDVRDVEILAPTRSALEVETSEEEDQEVHSEISAIFQIIVSFLQNLPAYYTKFQFKFIWLVYEKFQTLGSFLRYVYSKNIFFANFQIRQ